MKDDNKNSTKKGIGTSVSADAGDIAWQIFKKSGNINYYRLYSDLKKKDD